MLTFGRKYLSKGGMVKRYYQQQRMGSILNRYNVSTTTKNGWIRPAPRASGSRWQRQCGVPTSFEVRQRRKEKENIQLAAALSISNWDKSAHRLYFILLMKEPDCQKKWHQYKLDLSEDYGR
jgi:hypothetical protein